MSLVNFSIFLKVFLHKKGNDMSDTDSAVSLIPALFIIFDKIRSVKNNP